MAVEKMEMINVIGQMDDIDEIAKRLVLSSSVHMINAITEIHENNFPIVKAQNNVDALIDYNYIKQYTNPKNLGEIENKINALIDIFELRKSVTQEAFDDKYSFLEDVQRINELYELVREKHERIHELEEENNNIENAQRYLSYIQPLQLDLSELLNMKYIDVKIGRISRYSMDKIKNNYENISGIVFKLYQDKDNAIIIVFIPKPVEIEVGRVLDSLNFDEYKLGIKLEGTPSECLENLESRKRDIKSETDSIKAQLVDLKNEYGEDVVKYYSRLSMEYKIEELKSYVACTKEFFYLTGWIPTYKKEELKEYLGEYESKLILVYKETKEIREELQPPTCLKNNYLLKPFETVVKLYGVPSYNEVDPTGFVGLSYLFLFGAMFGDVGQGLVLFLLGEILSRLKKRPNLGGLLSRLGISSTIFGFVYGSFFGFEDVLHYKGFKPIQPMANINFILISAVVLGVFLLTIGFIYNLVNSAKTGDIENGVFSRNGAVGLVFYWLLLYTILSSVAGWKSILPTPVLVILLIALLAGMLFKEPISNLIKGKRPLYSESPADYYIEGGFGVLETLLSMFSNTVSFIRVGAFAINHVGLFIAFDTLAKMMTSGIASGLVIVIGNLIIIGLEGLIVFIQGLRLEYYELFSKYFSGAGYEYNPMFIKMLSSGKKPGLKVNKSNILINVN